MGGRSLGKEGGKGRTEARIGRRLGQDGGLREDVG